MRLACCHFLEKRPTDCCVPEDVALRAADKQTGQDEAREMVFYLHK